METKEKTTYTKEGKKPISTRKRPGEHITYDDVFSNALGLDPEIQKELDTKGLVPRFCDAKRMMEFGGHNDKGWQVYRRDKLPTDGAQDFKYGNDPTGIIRRGSLVLAVKSKEQADKHRRFLNQRASQQSLFAEKQAENLRDFAKQKGINAQILEGYDDEES